MKLLDQTVLVAIHFADNYLRHNDKALPTFVRVIYWVSLAISIKLNEDTILSLEDLASIFRNVYKLQLLCQLEVHIIEKNLFRLHPCTALDFVLHFVLCFK